MPEGLQITAVVDQDVQAASVQHSIEQARKLMSARSSLDTESRLPLVQLQQDCEVSIIRPSVKQLEINPGSKSLHRLNDVHLQ